MNNITKQGGIAVVSKSAEFVEKVLNAIDSPQSDIKLKELGWQSHGDKELRDNSWNKETIW